MPRTVAPLPVASRPHRSVRRRLVARVGELPVAAAVALGAQLPWGVAQAQSQGGTVITPLTGAAATLTTVAAGASGSTVVSTATLRDGNAFNHFSAFQVGQGDTVKLVVPEGANWLVNVVRDQRVRVDGHLLGKLGAADGRTGGNLLFIDAHGFAVGPQGRVDTGRLVFAAPSTTFVDALLGSGGGASASQVSAVLSGQFERSATGHVQVDGHIQASDSVQLMAGHGAGAAAAVAINGRIAIDGRRAGAAVNLGDLRSLAPVVERDGVIEVTTPGHLMLNGQLLADGTRWNQAGAVKVVAGGNIELGAPSRVSASAGQDSGMAGGLVSLFAHDSARNVAGAVLAARGDGAGAGGFIELSAARSVQVGGLLMDAGSDRGSAGVAYIDPEDITVSSHVYTNGGLALFEATQTVTVNAGVLINTRQVADSTDAAAALLASNPGVASTGHSGDIRILAPRITVGAGALLDASAVQSGGSSHRAGDISLLASQTTASATLLALPEAQARIDVAGTLVGRDIRLAATIGATATFGGATGSAQQGAIDLALQALGSPLALSVAYVQATGDARVTLRDTARLTATRDITILAQADRVAKAATQTEGSSLVNLSAGFARVAGSTVVDVQGGAQLQAGQHIDLVAASKTTVAMTSAAAGVTDENTNETNMASVVFAGAVSDVNTAVTVGAGAQLRSGGDTQLQAYHVGVYDTSASASLNGAGMAGLVGALALHNTTTSAAMDGQAVADGAVRVTAMNVSARNVVSATTSNVSDPPEESPLDGLPPTLAISQSQAESDAQAFAVKGLFTALSAAFADAADEAAADGSGGGGEEPKPPALRLAGALAWSETNHTTRASLGDGARVVAGTDAVVDAQTLVGRMQGVALSEATSETEGEDASRVALSVAFNYASHAHTTRAEVGAGAQVQAGRVAVQAALDSPEFYTAGLPTDWSNFYAAYANLMGGTGFLFDGFHTRVGASAAAQGLAAAGAVSLSYTRNDTRAWVDRGASITTSVTDNLPWQYALREVAFDSDLVKMLSPANTYSLDKQLNVLSDYVSATRVAPQGPPVNEIRFQRQVDAAVSVRAQNRVQSLHLAGGEGPASGGDGAAVGGTFSMVDRRNTAIAGVADGATVQTRRLDVRADTQDWLLTLSPTSGGGDGLAANGMASYNRLQQTTHASISREAWVTAPEVNVDARLDLGVLALTGALTQSENSGVGIGLAINQMTGDTRAWIGDNDTEGGGSERDEGPVGAIQTGALSVRARTEGMVVAVGVAGAAAGQDAPPDDPSEGTESPKSTTGQLADTSANKSSATQQQLDSNASAMAPVEQASAPAKAEGGDSAASEAPEASKPPSASIAGAGAIVINFSNLDTTALVDRAVVSGVPSGGVAGSTTVAVQAVSDLTQVSAAGGGALAMANNPATSFSAAIAGAVAIQDSDDDTTARIVNSQITGLADNASALLVRALKDGERTAVATGISANLSKGSTTSVSVVGSVSATHSRDDTLASIDNSTLTGLASVPQAAGAQVVAYDRSRIGAGGGALSLSTGKGAAGIGAAISLVSTQGSTAAQVSGGSLTRLYDLDVLALSSQKVVGVAAVAGVQTDASSQGQLLGSFVFNRIGHSLTAGVTGGAVVNLGRHLTVQAGGAAGVAALDDDMGAVRASSLTDYDMASAGNGYTDEFRQAAGGESIVGVAGTLGVTLGNNASSLGLSYVHNDIRTRYTAELNGQVQAGGAVLLQGSSRADIVGVAAGAGATKGKFSGMGSASVNLIGQQTQAALTGGSVTAGSLAVRAGSTGQAFAMAGNLSFAVGSGSGQAGGAAVAYTQTGAAQYGSGSTGLATQAAGNAATIANSRVDVGAGAVQVQAQQQNDIRSVAAAGAIADGNLAFAGTVTVNDIGDSTSALVDNTLLTAGQITVRAGESADGRTASVQSLAGGVSASKGYSGALALGFNTIASVRSAQVQRSNLIIDTAVTVQAAAEGQVRSIAATLAGGKDYAAAGSVTVNTLNADVLARYDGAGNSLRGNASSLSVLASASGRIESLAGSVSAAGTGAIGGALSINQMGQGSDQLRVRALLGHLDIFTHTAVDVQASLSSYIGAIAASGGGAGTAAVTGSVTRNLIDADVQAEVERVRTRTDIGNPPWLSRMAIKASNQASIESLAGSVAGGGNAAVGLAVSVNQVGGRVLARLADTGAENSLRVSDEVTVDAENTGSIKAIAAGVSAAGTNAGTGSNATNALTSTVLAQMHGINQWGDPATVRVRARDNSAIQAFAGAVGAAGSAAAGAALALNFLGRDADNQARHKVVRAEVTESLLRVTGEVLVQAASNASIEATAVAAGGGTVGGINGSASTNLLEDEVTALWSSSGLMPRTANRLSLQAHSAARIASLAGNLSGSGGASMGAAVAVNRIGTHTRAQLTATPGSIRSDSMVLSNDLLVDALSDNDIETVAVGMSAGAGGTQGSVAVSAIGSTTQALVGGAGARLTNISVRDTALVSAHSHDRIRALAGAAGLGAGAMGLAGGAVTNLVSSQTVAGVSGDVHLTAAAQGEGLTARTQALASSPDLMNINQVSNAVMGDTRLATRTVKGVAVQATAIQQIGAVTAVAGGGAAAAGAAAVNVDQISGSTRAYFDGVQFVNEVSASADPVYDRTPAAAQAVQLLAVNHAMIASSATALAIGSTGVSGAVATEIIDRSTRAEVLGGSRVAAQGEVAVRAHSTQTVAQIAAGAAGGLTAGIAGSGDVVLIRGETVARVDGSSVSAGRIDVVANGANRANLIAGSVAGGGAVGAGLSFTVNVSGATVQALVHNSPLLADGAVVIDADNTTESLSVSAAGAVGGTAGVAVGASVTVVEGRTEAAMTGSSSLGRRTRATGLVASAGDAPVTLHLAAPDDLVGTGNQHTVRFSLHNLSGRVSDPGAVVTVSDGDSQVIAVRQADGTYVANVAGLADGLLMAQVVTTESGVSKVATTTLIKSTGINGSDEAPRAEALPTAQTRIATLSAFEEVDARHLTAVRFVLKGDAGPTVNGDAVVTVSDGSRSVQAVLLADGSYSADVSSLGDGMLTALVSVPGSVAGSETSARVTFLKNAGAGSLSITADEHLVLNHNAGQVGVGGVSGLGSSANVVIGKSTVDARLDATSVRVSGALAVTAQRDADIDMVTATGGAGGFAGVSGAVGVLLFGEAPSSDTNRELTGEQSSLGSVSAATQSGGRSAGAGSALSAEEAAALDNRARYDTQAAYAGATGGHRTSATLAAQLVVAGSVQVIGVDRTVVDNNAGAVALGGAAGVSAGVAITQLGGANHAGVSVGQLTVAGDLDIASGTRNPGTGAAIESRAIAGAGGFVGIGAAVSVASNTSANTASLAGQSLVGGSTQVRALDQASMFSQAVGASAGFLSVGVVAATARQSGAVSTTIAGNHSAQGYTATAERDASTRAMATAGAAGVYAGAGAGALAVDEGRIALLLAAGTVLDAGDGDLELSAKSTPSAQADAIGVSVSRGAAVGVSVADTQVKTQVQAQSAGALTLRGNQVLVSAVLGSGASLVQSRAVAGGGGLLLGAQGAVALASNQGSAQVLLTQGATLQTQGNASFAAYDAMSVASQATGVGVGFVGAGVAVAHASSQATVGANAGALRGTVGAGLSVVARGDERIDADAVAGTGGVLAGAGADARVDHRLNASADMTTGAGGLQVQGLVQLTADRRVRYDSRSETLNASAFGASGAVTVADLRGSASARLGNGAQLGAAQLRILANNDVERSNLSAVSAQGGGGGVLAGAGADASTVINGDALADIGDDVTLRLGQGSSGLLELRAYNQLRGSSLGRLDVGGALPIALVNTDIQSNAQAQARLGQRNDIWVAGEVYANALSYVDIEANTITKTYGAAAAAQGNANALANVSNQVTVGQGTQLVSEGSIALLAGQDRGFWRNKSFVTARADLFNHSAIPVSINPAVQAELNLANNVAVHGQAVRSGGNIQLGGIEGTYVVEGKGKVSDWTRDVGELIGVSSQYGTSKKTLTANANLNGVFEAGFGNKQIIVIRPDGSLDASKTQGNIRYSIATEDLAATGAAYLDTLYDQLKNYGDIPEVRAFVEAEIAFYLSTLVREGFATLETDPETGKTEIVAQASVPGTFLTVQNVRAGSGNVELFGHNVTGSAQLVARADSEILIDNHSPMNIRVKDLVIDSSGGFVKYNGVYLTQANGAEIAGYNRNLKTGVAMTVDSIDTRGGAAGEQLPTLQVINRYVSNGTVSSDPVMAEAPDGSSADLRQDQLRAPELRVNGLLYNKLGPILLSNTAGSISVVQEDLAYVPRVDGLEVQVSAGKNFVLSSPSVSQSIGGSPENLYAVAYTQDQQTKLDNMGVVRCGTARPGVSNSLSFNADCRRDGAGGIYANGGIFLGARYLNINGTIQSGQPDFTVTLTDASVGASISAWEADWEANRGRYLAQGRSSLLQVAGRLPTDNESEVIKRFANGSITLAQRDALLSAMATRRLQPVVYYDAETNRLKVAATEVKGGLVEVVGSIINTGGGVIRALDGYARFQIDNQTSYGMDLLGLDTGGEAGLVRITDLNRPIYTDGRVSAYQVTSYQRDPLTGQFKSTVTAGRGGAVLATGNSTLTTPNAARPELLATFSYAPVTNSTYVWSAGYETGQEKRYWYQKSSALWGAINLGTITWNSVEVINKTTQAMPEGIYVTTANAPSSNFSMSMERVPLGDEKTIYYRSWKKCGFLCFKKTYYVDYRTEVAQKDIFTQRVRADHPIAIELVGYNTGLINVQSKGDVRIAGGIVNDSGLVSIRSTQGAIEQLSGGTSVQGQDLRFYAATGIGNEGAPVNVITGNGAFTAVSSSGNVAFQSLGGAMRINQVSTTGKVWLLGDGDIVGVNAGDVHVSGSRIVLAAPRGGIGLFHADGSVQSTLNIQTEDSAGGGITAHAARGIALKQGRGNLWVDQVASSGGDVYIEAAGDLIDNNRNETRDLRTEQELLALWNAAALQGDSAEQSLQRTLANTRAQYRRYWSLRNATVDEVNPSTGAVTAFTADPYNPVFVFSGAEKAQLAQSGLTLAQIADLEAARSRELQDLHSLFGNTAYQLDNSLIIAEVNAANAAAGRPAVDAMATWSDAELKSPLPKAIFTKSSTDTQTRIEEPNVVGNRVVLRPGGKIGRDEGSVTIDLRKAGGLTVEDQLTIMSAESDDMTLDRDRWLLTVVKKDTFDVLSSRLNVISNGFVYLGSDVTDAYPNGGNANLEQVLGNGEIRIKVSGSILNASQSAASVIQGHKAILEAASGSIGSADKPLTLTLTGGGNVNAATLVARADEGIWIRQQGDIRLADLYSPGAVHLTATGAIIDARGSERLRSIEAGEATLVALGGAVGSRSNPVVVQMAKAGVSATSATGHSVFLQGAGGGLTVNHINAGLDIELYAPSGTLRANGLVRALGRIDAESEDDLFMASGARFEAVTGDIAIAADDVGLSQLDASRAVVVVARGAITDTHTGDVNVNAAGRSVTLMAQGSIGSMAKPVDVLTRDRTRVVATSRNGGVYLGADAGVLRIAQVSAQQDVLLSSAFDILDERGARTHAVEGALITLQAGGNVGLAAAPLTFKTHADGSVRVNSLAGSAFLKAPLGELHLSGADLRLGRLVADGSQAGLRLSGQIAASTGLSLIAGNQALRMDASADVHNGSGQALLRGSSITMADGAQLAGGSGTVLFTAVNDIALTGVSSGNDTANAIVVSSSRGAVLDAGDTNAYDLRTTHANGGIRVSAYLSVGNAGLSASAAGHALDTDAHHIDVTSRTGAVLLAQGQRAVQSLRVSARQQVHLSSAGQLTGSLVSAQGGDVRIHTSQGAGVFIDTINSRTGAVHVHSGGGLQLRTLSAQGDVDLQSRDSLVLLNGRSRTAAVALVSLAGGVTAGSVQSATGLKLQAHASASLNTFRAGAGATFEVGAALALGSGRAVGNIDITLGGKGALGSLQSTAGRIDAQSTGSGLVFQSLRAFNGVGLSAAAAMDGEGPEAGHGLYGQSVNAGNGAVQASARAGKVQLGLLQARQSSRVDAYEDLTISKISLLSGTTFTYTTAGANAWLPEAYR